MSNLLRFSRILAARPPCAFAFSAPMMAKPAVPFRSVGTAAPVKPGPDNYMRGRQLAEFEREHELEGVAGFNDQPAEGDFGTMAKPVRIYSAFHSRIVGCKGGDHNQHRMFWFELKEGPKHVCTECGQVFKLVTPASSGAASQSHSH